MDPFTQFVLLIFSAGFFVFSIIMGYRLGYEAGKKSMKKERKEANNSELNEDASHLF